jgi:hypothetical protein
MNLLLLFSGMPNSSGAPVLLDTKFIAGLYTSILFHQQDLDPKVLFDHPPPPSTMETSPSNLWEDEVDLPLADNVAAQLSFINIGHKSFHGGFVTTLALVDCLRQANDLPPIGSAPKHNSRPRKKQK